MSEYGFVSETKLLVHACRHVVGNLILECYLKCSENILSKDRGDSIWKTVGSTDYRQTDGQTDRCID